MHSLILLLYKSFDYVKITYIGVFLKLVYTVLLDISDYRFSVLLCCSNVRYRVLITLRLALLSCVTAMLFTFSGCLVFALYFIHP
jgi:hypothetical protein